MWVGEMIREDGVVCKCEGSFCTCEADSVRAYVRKTRESYSGHAYMSPSSLYRRIGCAASASREFLHDMRRKFILDNLRYHAKDDPFEINRVNLLFDSNMEDADNGTILHGVFQVAIYYKWDRDKMLQAIADPSQLIRYISNIEGGISEGEKGYFATKRYTETDESIVNKFCEVVEDMQSRFYDDPEVVWFATEMKIELPGFGDTFGTADLVYRKLKTICVPDLKTGMMGVDAKDNPQFYVYALGVCEALGHTNDDDDVEVEVVPIRFPASREQLKYSKLLSFRKMLEEVFYRAHSLNPVATPGHHCMYCSVKHVCREVIEHTKGYIPVMNTAESTFDTAGESPFKDVSTKQMVDDFLSLKIGENIVKAIKQELEERFAGFGEDTDNRVKMVSPKPVKKIADEATAITKIKSALGVKASGLIKEVLIDAKVIEKQIPKELAAEIITEENRRPYLRLN